MAWLGGETELPDLEARFAAYPGCLRLQDLPIRPDGAAVGCTCPEGTHEGTAPGARAVC